MKIILGLTFAALFIVCGLVTTSAAQSNGGNNLNINARQHNQQMRIADGIRDGTLTKAEAGRLQRREAVIRRMEARLRESGNVLTPKERRFLQVQLNQTDRMIFRLRHNQQQPKA